MSFTKNSIFGTNRDPCITMNKKTIEATLTMLSWIITDPIPVPFSSGLTRLFIPMLTRTLHWRSHLAITNTGICCLFSTSSWSCRTKRNLCSCHWLLTASLKKPGIEIVSPRYWNPCLWTWWAIGQMTIHTFLLRSTQTPLVFGLGPFFKKLCNRENFFWFKICWNKGEIWHFPVINLLTRTFLYINWQMQGLWW